MAASKDWSIEVQRRKKGGAFQHLTWGSWKHKHAPKFHRMTVPAEAIQILKEIAFAPADASSRHDVRIGEYTYRFILSAMRSGTQI